jgi:hypothetical protein
MFGHPPQREVAIPTGSPNFISEIFESGLSPKFRTRCSFNTILEILKRNNFEIEDDVDSAGISAFVSWVESVEYPDQ